MALVFLLYISMKYRKKDNAIAIIIINCMTGEQTYIKTTIYYNDTDAMMYVINDLISCNGWSGSCY